MSVTLWFLSMAYAEQYAQGDFQKVIQQSKLLKWICTFYANKSMQRKDLPVRFQDSTTNPTAKPLLLNEYDLLIHSVTLHIKKKTQGN